MSQFSRNSMCFNLLGAIDKWLFSQAGGRQGKIPDPFLCHLMIWITLYKNMIEIFPVTQKFVNQHSVLYQSQMCVSVLTIFLHPSKPCLSALVISLPQLWLFSLSHLYIYLNYASFLYISALYCTFLCLLYHSLYVPALSPLCPIQIPASPVPFSILTKKRTAVTF